MTGPVPSAARRDADSPRIISPYEHGIEPAAISSNAIEVVESLRQAGFSSELVGGCVRDLLLGRQPKDFDVATSARPDQVKSLFRRCDVFGRRFKIAEVWFRGEGIQVATYRKPPILDSRRRRSRNYSARGKILKDNRFGDIREDAFRRDLTINSLYLHPSDMRVVDYTGGFEDAQHRIVRCIGDPMERYREDPVRMLRAVRFATLPGFRVAVETEAAIAEQANLLTDVSNYRLTDEVTKMLFNGRALPTFELLYQHNLFRVLFPPYRWLHAGLNNDHGVVDWLRMLFRETDERIARDEHISVAFTLAAVHWPRFRNAMSKHAKKRRPASRRIAEGVLSQQNERTYLSGQLVYRITDIWQLQSVLESCRSGEQRVVEERNFRSAVRLLELRAKAGEIKSEVVEPWVMMRDRQQQNQRRRRRRFRRRSKRR